MCPGKFEIKIVKWKNNNNKKPSQTKHFGYLKLMNYGCVKAGKVRCLRQRGDEYNEARCKGMRTT